MTYDPLDTDENDNNADGDISFETVNGFGIVRVSTFDGLPAIDPAQIAFVADENEYYFSTPKSGTPFDIASATFSKSLNTQDGAPTGIAWNNDGSRLYEVGAGDDKIYESTVSTPFDITSATFSTSINTQDQNSRGIAWNNDGSRLYEVGQSGVKIYQYTVSTPFDIASASFSTSINTQDSNPFGIAWNNDGSLLYEVGSIGSKIYQSQVSSGGWKKFKQ